MDSDKKKSRPIPKGRARRPAQVSREARQEARADLEQRTVELHADIESLRSEIAEREKIEAALRKSEPEYRDLFENAHDAILIFRPEDEVVLEVNQRACELYGFTRSEFIGMTLEKITKDVPRGKNHIGATLDKRMLHHYESVHLRKDGSEMSVEINASVVNYKGQWAIQSIHRDITERKRAEEALKESEEKYRLLVENLNQGILVLQDGLLNFVNPRAVEFSGYSEEELSSTPFLNFVHPDDRGMIAERYQQRLKGEEILHTYEFRFIDKQGQVKWVEVNSVLIAWKGKPAALSFLSDISSRRRAEEALRQSEGLSRALISHSPVGISVRTRDGSLLQVNEAWKKIWAMTDREIQEAEQETAGRSFEERFPYLGKAAQEVQQVFSSEGGPQIQYLPELEIKNPRPGAAHWISLYLYALRDEQGQVERVITLTQDITERKRLEEQFLQAQKMEAVGRLAGGVAHDFNNLLTGIMGYSDLLCQKLQGPGGDEALRRYAEVILSSANRASNLTQQLLTLSRRHVVQLQVLDLSAVVADTNKMLKRLIGEDIEVVTHLNPGLGRVRADPVQIEQVLMNLAVNARDAMPQGGRLTIRTANVFLNEAYARRYLEITPGPYVMLSLSDSGHGMGPEVKSHLFEPFFTTKEKGKGTGLGLSTVYSIVKQGGGHIEVESAPEQGTTFKIYLPRVGGRGDLLASPLPEGAPAELPSGTETVLVAEDDEKVRWLIREVLEGAGYAVLEAADGGQALEAAGRHQGPIHLLVADVVMPRLSGPNLASLLVSSRPKMKVLYISGYTDGEVSSYGGLDSGIALLQKPFKGEALARRVRKILDGP